MAHIKTELQMRTTAALDQEVIDELQVPDPSLENAEAVLKKRNDEDEQDEATKEKGQD
jgi:hypothetical protein